MKKLLALIIAVLVPINSFATECQQDVSIILANATAPCDGFLFSKPKELQVRIMSKDYTNLQQQNANLTQTVTQLQAKDKDNQTIIQDTQKQSEIWRGEAISITNKYTQVEENRSKRDLLMILLGVVATGVAGYAVGAAARASR